MTEEKLDADEHSYTRPPQCVDVQVAGNRSALSGSSLGSLVVPAHRFWQIFLRDPNNVEIELNFEVKNEAN